MNQVSVHIEQSIAIGKVVGQLHFRPEFLKRDFLSIPLDKETKAAMYFYSVGICHQTYHLAHKKLNLFGWDFLEYGFLQIAREKPELLDATFLVKTDAPQLIQLIKPFFAESNKAENCTLDRLDERVRLWKDMAAFILRNNKSLVSFIDSSQNQAEYFYKNLSKTEAYSDPLQKKTSFLMKLLEDVGYADFSQSENIMPIMDYHMQRVLMRTGCVEIEDTKLNRQLVEQEKIANDSEIRKACINSMKIIAKESGFSVLKMNDVFYTMGRSCCHENPLCVSQSCAKDPCTLSLAVDIPEKHHCIFKNICKGANNENYRQLWQPLVETHFY